MTEFALDEADEAAHRTPTSWSSRAATARSPASQRLRRAPASGSPSSRPGTANDFARELEIPLELGEACRIAAEGSHVRRLDVGRMGDRPFLNVASTGLPPAAAEHADGLKEKLGPLAYAVGRGARRRRGGSLRPAPFAATTSEIHTGEAWQVTVACSGAFGGGSSIETELSDSKLDVVVIEAGSRLKLAQHAYGLRRGGIGEQEGVTKVRCAEATVELDGVASLERGR